MAGIFLSYAREDRGCVDALARLLEGAGHEVWWDRHIDSGSEFAGEIEAALETADVVLVAWSKDSVKSRWVRDEAGTGGDTGRLVPVTLDGSQPPMGFRQFQTLDLTGWKGAKRDSRTAELLRSIDRRLKSKGKLAPATAAKPRFTASTWLEGWRLWTAAAAILFLAATAVALVLLRSGQAHAEPASLAVLPFKNMAAGSSYFAEGVAEEISDQLSREPQFKVAGRTSAALFKDAADLRDVGQRLHVAYVLEGSVRSAGNQVRVDVALVDTSRGMRLWSQDFRGSLNDMFAIQDQIGQQVAAHVRRQLVAQVAPADHLTTNGEVYSLTVTARSLMHTREPSKISAAIDLLNRAVKMDPNYAPAWARLALALSIYEKYKPSDNAGERDADAERVFAVATADAQRAIALAPALADGHAVLALLLTGDGDMNAAKIRRGREELEKAVRLNPGDAESWFWLHYPRVDQLDFNGALDALRQSARIDPLFILNEQFPGLASDMGYRKEALRFLNDRIANHPDPFIREIARAQLAYLQGERAKAYQFAKKAREIALPDVRSIAEDHMGAILLELQLLDQAERLVPKPLVDMRRGKMTFAKRLREAFPRALDFWREMDGDRHLLPRLLVKLGQSTDLVALYDEAFSSPENMAARYPHLAFVEYAPMLAVALHQSGRREGARILLLADDMCRRGMQGEHTPRSFRVSCSRLWAVLGHKDLAIGTLEQAVREGWRPVDGEYPLVGDEPAYAVIRDDPRIKRIDALFAAEIARERRELLAAGL
jgi:TolB-like protein